jgi:hypothetical protein
MRVPTQGGTPTAKRAWLQAVVLEDLDVRKVFGQSAGNR